MTDGQIRYTTTPDGARIAYIVSGEGPPLLHLPNGGLSSIIYERRMPGRHRWIAALERHFRVIRYDARGTGLSQREIGDWKWEDFVVEAIAVLDALQVESAVLLGYLGSGWLAPAVAALHPTRVSHVILWPGDVRMPKEGEADQLVLRDWENQSELYGHVVMGWDRSTEARIIASVLRESITPETYVKLWEVSHRFMPDMSIDCAHRVTAPALAIQAPPTWNPDLRAAFLSAFPNCTTEIIPGLPTVPFVGDMTPIIETIVRFVGLPPVTAPQNGAVLTSREVEVLRLIGRGLSNQEIAGELVVSTRTVEQHLANAYAKLGFEGKSARSAAAAYIARHEAGPP